MDTSKDPFGINEKWWNTRKIASRYSLRDDIIKPERAICERIGANISGGKILDLGCGSGRTTGFLLEMSTDYVGLDYSPAMIRLARERFLGVEFVIRDARDLTVFGDNEFDLVFFSHNGIDYSSRNDRKKILHEVYRVLREGGFYVFSSHNRDWSGFADGGISRIDLSRNLVRTFANLVRWAKGSIAHQIRRRNEFTSDEYCILYDPYYNYSFLTFYATADYVKRELRSVGFNGTPSVFDLQGCKVESDCKSSELYYLVTK
jgi:ubiquinone/menaquinone biosynthesis C-methylase UbiE